MLIDNQDFNGKLLNDDADDDDNDWFINATNFVSDNQHLKLFRNEGTLKVPPRTVGDLNFVPGNSEDEESQIFSLVAQFEYHSQTWLHGGISKTTHIIPLTVRVIVILNVILSAVTVTHTQIAVTRA